MLRTELLITVNISISHFLKAQETDNFSLCESYFSVQQTAEK